MRAADGFDCPGAGAGAAAAAAESAVVGVANAVAAAIPDAQAASATRAAVSCAGTLSLPWPSIDMHRLWLGIKAKIVITEEL